MPNKIKFIAIFICLVFISSNTYALDGVEILSGYLTADLDQKGAYEVIPLFFALNFDAKPIFSKIGIKPKGRLNFVLEPFLNTVVGPDPNIEIGSNFLIKYTFPLSKKIRPYAKGGLGVLYMSQHTREQSTQYNFLPQIGGGFHYFIDDNTALSFEYRYRHLSNASFGNPNAGIDAKVFLGGISFFFK